MMNSLEPVSVTRLYRMIADQIAAKIRSGGFEVGKRLPSERELADTLQVSRTSVREALIALELEGYVDVRVGAGIFVLPLKENRTSTTNAIADLHPLQSDIGPFELISVHLLVEPECAALAAKHGSAEQIAAIEAVGRRMEGSSTPRAHNRAFHIAVAEATGNTAMVVTVTNLWNLHDNSVMFHKLEQLLVTREVWKVAEAEHDALIRAILARDPEAARKAMRDHFLGSSSRLGEDFGGEAEIV